MIRTIDGEPGTYWRNLTPDIWFQWEVFPDCCEVCLRLDRQLVPADFPAELHPNCRCTRTPIGPLERAPRPFRSFKEKALAVRPSEWRVELFGLSNLRLVKAGLVAMDDLLAEDRIRDFAEVVRRKKLTVDQLVSAGVGPGLAERAVAMARAAAAAAVPAGRGREVP
jgi:hypothetical protein